MNEQEVGTMGHSRNRREQAAYTRVESLMTFHPARRLR